jgi:predicted enzyme related to lactoylglutathione lyase
MRLEYFALNVSDDPAMSLWYETCLGLSIVKKMNESPFTTFLVDDGGTIMLEIYTNPKGETLDFTNLHSLAIHLALVSADPNADRNRLVEAGAKVVSDEVLPDGSRLIMLRDPWGISFQLCRRAKSMLKST